MFFSQLQGQEMGKRNSVGSDEYENGTAGKAKDSREANGTQSYLHYTLFANFSNWKKIPG